MSGDPFPAHRAGPGQGAALSAPQPQRPLTRRQGQLLPLLLAGQTNKQMARTLGISPDTVKDHLTRLYPKYGVPDRRALMVLHLVSWPAPTTAPLPHQEQP